MSLGRYFLFQTWCLFGWHLHGCTLDGNLQRSNESELLLELLLSHFQADTILQPPPRHKHLLLASNGWLTMTKQQPCSSLFILGKNSHILFSQPPQIPPIYFKMAPWRVISPAAGTFFLHHPLGRTAGPAPWSCNGLLRATGECFVMSPKEWQDMLKPIDPCVVYWPTFGWFLWQM